MEKKMNNWYTRLRTLVLKTIAVITEGSGERAKDSRGRFIPDDKSTPDVNEAYKDGKKPSKTSKRKPKTVKDSLNSTIKSKKVIKPKVKSKGKGKAKLQVRVKAAQNAKAKGRPKGSKNKK